jgi:hypothetical protein
MMIALFMRGLEGMRAVRQTLQMSRAPRRQDRTGQLGASAPFAVLRENLEQGPQKGHKLVESSVT